MKKILAMLLVLVMVLGLAACGAKEKPAATTVAPTEAPATGEVMAWTSEFAFNSDSINQWKTIYLLDEDNYVITVKAVDSKDATKVTADFYMAGKYTLEGNSLFVEPGYGYTYALNGDTPIQMPITPAEDGSMSGMYAAMMGMFASITLNADGTWTGNEADVEAGEFVACYAPEAKVYTAEFAFNSDTINQWKKFYLLNDDTVAVTVYATDSKDAAKVTADFYMTAKYTLEGNALTVEPGYGYTSALNGDTPIQMPISPAEDGAMSGMYAAMIGMYSSITLNEDGSWEGVE